MRLTLGFSDVESSLKRIYKFNFLFTSLVSQRSEFEFIGSSTINLNSNCINDRVPAVQNYHQFLFHDFFFCLFCRAECADSKSITNSYFRVH